MSTKTCKKCGWVYPINAPGVRCKICKEPFDIVVCRACGEIIPAGMQVPGVNLCKPCHNAEERQHMVTYRSKRDEGFVVTFEAWKERIAAVPKNYPTLTEEQWMEACKYFGGCAQCGADTIEARGFFISFESGGRYCDWNVIPMCHKCATDWKKVQNPFRLAWARDNKGRASNRRECIKRIVDYLGGRLDAATRVK